MERWERRWNLQRGARRARMRGRWGEKTKLVRGREVEEWWCQMCEEMRGKEIQQGKMRTCGAVEYGSDWSLSVVACTVQNHVLCIYLSIYLTHMEQHMVTANWKEVIQLGAFGWLIVSVTCIYPRAGMMLWRSHTHSMSAIHSWNCLSHLDRRFNWVHPTTLQMCPLLFHYILLPVWPVNWYLTCDFDSCLRTVNHSRLLWYYLQSTSDRGYRSIVMLFYSGLELQISTAFHKTNKSRNILAFHKPKRSDR